MLGSVTEQLLAYIVTDWATKFMTVLKGTMQMVKMLLRCGKS